MSRIEALNWNFAWVMSWIESYIFCHGWVMSRIESFLKKCFESIPESIQFLKNSFWIDSPKIWVVYNPGLSHRPAAARPLRRRRPPHRRIQRGLCAWRDRSRTSDHCCRRAAIHLRPATWRSGAGRGSLRRLVRSQSQLAGRQPGGARDRTWLSTNSLSSTEKRNQPRRGGREVGGGVAAAAVAAVVV